MPAGSLSHALGAVARQAKVSVGYVGRLPGKKVVALKVNSVEAALTYIARSAGLVMVRVGPSRFRLEAEPIDPDRGQVKAPGLVPNPLPPEILVTATKRDEALSHLPLSVSVVQVDALHEASGLASTQDMVANISSLTRTNLGPGRNRLFIRGVADSPFNGPTQSTIGLYLGEARLNYDTPDPDLRLVDVARVEVLKGPQGALYGSGVLGGVYHIVPHVPEEGWSGFAGMALGSTAHGGANIAAYGMANIPLNAGLGLRAVGYAEHNAGWIDDPRRNAANVNAERTMGGRLAARWTPGALTVDVIGAGQWTSASDSQYAASKTGPYARATAMSEPHHTHFASGQIKLTRAFGPLTGVFTSAIVHHDLASRFDASASQPGGSVPVAYDEARGQNLLTNEARLADDEGRVQWLWGLYHLADSSTVSWSLGPLGATGGANIYRKAYRELATFGDISVGLTAQLRVQIGGRLFQATNEERHTLSRDIEHGSDWRANPSAALSWQPNAETLIWVHFADATRPGGLNPSATSAPFTFAADKLTSTELGVRTRQAADRLTIEAAIFQLRWRDIQSDILLDSGLIGTINAGQAHNVGAEVMGRWTAPSWNVELSATGQFAELYSQSQLLGSIRDARLPTVPKFRANARAEADVPGFGPDVKGGITAQFNGPSHLSFDPRLDRRTSAYALIGLYMGWPWHGFDVRLSADNLLNSAADSFAFGNPFSVRQFQQITPVRPRQLTLGIRRDF